MRINNYGGKIDRFLCPLLLFVVVVGLFESKQTERFDISIIEWSWCSNAGSFVDPSIDLCE